MSDSTAPNDFAILEAIWAIPADALSSAAKLLLCVHVRHAGFGRSKCTAPNDLLAFEAGVKVRQISQMNAKLVEGGWLIETRLGESKFTERQFTIGPKTWQWAKQQMAEFRSRREEKRLKRLKRAPSTAVLGSAPSTAALANGQCAPSTGAPGNLALQRHAPSTGAPGNLALQRQHNSSINSPLNANENSSSSARARDDEEAKERETIQIAVRFWGQEAGEDVRRLIENFGVDVVAPIVLDRKHREYDKRGLQNSCNVTYGWKRRRQETKGYASVRRSSSNGRAGA
jgi:hypothetical protein